jgi:hypothetical protein
MLGSRDNVETESHMQLLSRSKPRRRVLLVAVGCLLLPGAASAQKADFLFKRPRATLGFHFGYAMPRAGSDVFEQTREELTLGARDLDAFALSAELAYRVNERLDVGIEVGWSEGKREAEYRDWVGDDDLPILQTTRLARRPVTLNVRAYLFDRGRSISRFAWVPGSWAPWIGAGGGWLWYDFERDGEFIDFETLDIVRDQIGSEETVPTVHLMGGADVSLGPRFAFTGQLRYSWASAQLDPRYFEGFEDIDLAGFRATAGIKVRL